MKLVWILAVCSSIFLLMEIAGSMVTAQDSVKAQTADSANHSSPPILPRLSVP
jgi:hypothetical protein